MGDWLELEGKKIVVCGIANKRSVGFHVGKRLQAVGAEVLWVCHTEARRDELAKRLDGSIYVCDVEKPDELEEGQDWRDAINPDSKEVLRSCKVEPGLAEIQAGTIVQFERKGYFCADPEDGPPATCQGV